MLARRVSDETPCASSARAESRPAPRLDGFYSFATLLSPDPVLSARWRDRFGFDGAGTRRRSDGRPGSRPPNMPDDSSEVIPIFPLANVVLFPTISVPLHIFEPRYRQMTRDAMVGARRIGMVAVRPEHRDDMTSDPPVFDVGCEGAISHAEERPDGTWNLLLVATRRFRIIDELKRPAVQLYRSARIETLDDPVAEDASLQPIRASIRARLGEIVKRLSSSGGAPPSLERLDELDDHRFVNVLAQALDFGVLEKQRLLEASGNHNRATILDDLLQFRLFEIGAQSGTGSDRMQ